VPQSRIVEEGAIPASPAVPRRSALDLVTVVWGEAYTRLFLEFALPSELAAGNIPRLAARGAVRYRIFTTPEDASVIRAARAYSELMAQIDVEIDIVTFAAPELNKYLFVSRWHLRASNEAFERAAYAVFLCPDGVYADGALGAIADYADQGCQAVMTFGMRTVLETATVELRVERAGLGVALTVAPRDAVALALRNLHPIERALFWDQKDVYSWPSHVYFRIDPETFVAHCWHLHPIMVKPGAQVDERIGTIDGSGYLAAMVSDIAKVRVVADTDDFFFAEFTPANRLIMPTRLGPLAVGELARWARQHADPLHRHFFSVPVTVHTGPLDEARREMVRNYSALVRRSFIEPALGLSALGPLERAARAAAAAYVGARRLPSRLWRKLRETRRRMSRVRIKFWIAERLRRIAAFLVRPAARAATLLTRVHGPTRIAVIEMHQRIGRAITESVPDYWRADLPSRSLRAGLEALDHGNLQLAHDALRLARTLRPDDENAFYELLVETLRRLKDAAETEARRLEIPGDARPRRVFSMVVWGHEYIDNFTQYTLRSMFAEGNLPALQDGRVFMSIVTTPSGERRIRSKDSFRVLERYASIHFFTFPEALTEPFHYSRPTFNFYRLYGALDHTSIHFARALRADIYFIVVDGLLSSNTLGSLARFVAEGYDICANASIVSNRETLLPALDAAFGGEEAIEISSRDLANLGMEHRHDYITQRLVVAENRDFDKYPRELYFPTEEGLVVHALYQHPLVISHRAICKDVEFDYFIVDSKLMARIFTDPAEFPRVKIITDSNDAYVANFAPRMRRFETTGQPPNVKDFVAVHLNTSPIHHFIWRHRQLIRCDTRLRTHLDPERVSAEFLAALVAAQRKRRG